MTDAPVKFWKDGGWWLRYRVERWFRLRWCAIVTRARWLPEPSWCYFGCPSCEPDFGEGKEGEALYQEWREMEDELLGELAQRSESRRPTGGPRPRVMRRG
jgi:hypothetical protein